MMCPQCGVWTTVKETRAPKRLRECGNSHRFWTVEVVELPEHLKRLEQARRVLREKGYLK